MKPREVYIKGFGGLKSVCPNCLTKMDGLTAVRADRPWGQRVRLAGHYTMCGYCTAMLIFTDDEGRLRVMTRAERVALSADTDGFSAYLRRVMREYVIETNRKRPPNFTKKVYS